MCNLLGRGSGVRFLRLLGEVERFVRLDFGDLEPCFELPDDDEEEEDPERLDEEPEPEEEPEEEEEEDPERLLPLDDPPRFLSRPLSPSFFRS